MTIAVDSVFIPELAMGGYILPLDKYIDPKLRPRRYHGIRAACFPMKASSMPPILPGNHYFDVPQRPL